MREDNRGTNWLITAAAAVIAVIFIILWIMRGSDVSRLNQELQAAKRSAEESTARLKGDVKTLRSEVAAAVAKATDAGKLIAVEKSRADGAEAEIARISGSQIELAETRQRLREAEERLKEEEARGRDVSSRLEEALGAVAATRDRMAGLEQTNRELGDAWDRVAELEQTLADERNRATDLNRRLQASATVIASAESDAALLARTNDELAGLRVRLSGAEKAIDAERRRAAELGARLDRSTALLEEAERELATGKNARELLTRSEIELADALAEIERLRTPGAEVPPDNGESAASINIMLRQQRERAAQAHERAAEIAQRLKTLEAELEAARLEQAAKDEKSAAEARTLAAGIEAARRTILEREQAAERAEREFQARLEQARAELAERERIESEARQSLEERIAELQNDLALANQTREQVAAELRERYEKRLAESQGAAEAARGRLEEVARREQAAQRLRENLHEQLAAAQKALADRTRLAAGEMASLVEARASLQMEVRAAGERERELQAGLGEARRSLAAREEAARAARDALNAELAGLGETVSALETQIARLNREKGDRERELDGLSLKVRDLQIEVGEYAAVFGAEKPRDVRRTIDGYRGRVESLGAELADSNRAKAEIERQLSHIQARLDRYVALLDGETPEAAARRINNLERLLDDLEATLAHYNEALGGEPPEEVAAALRRLEADVDDYGQAFGFERPGRFVGEIVDAMDHNRALVLNLGAKDRVRAGMKFDVYRKIGDRNRYIGMVHVIRAYEDTSLAVATLRRETVMVCPKTGFVVLEPGARFSPFARGGDGEPLPLVEDGTIDTMTEAPGIGDFVNNPFYDPARPMVFAVHPDASADGVDGKKAVELIGGVAKEWPTATAADHRVVPMDTLDSWPSGREGRGVVSIDHLLRYYAPLGVITPQPAPPCPDPDCLPIRQ
ncbi:MAG: hypothetical protein LBJ46_08825 [Planctomycetota bacterium]|jgi:chromosome segregation ATPase|nr:hypothetical protein [Planctomycetota bacterium]